MISSGINNKDTFGSPDTIIHFCRVSVGKERIFGCNIVQTLHISVMIEDLNMNMLHKKLVKFLKEFEKDQDQK